MRTRNATKWKSRGIRSVIDLTRKSGNSRCVVNCELQLNEMTLVVFGTEFFSALWMGVWTDVDNFDQSLSNEETLQNSAVMEFVQSLHLSRKRENNRCVCECDVVFLLR